MKMSYDLKNDIGEWNKKHKGIICTAEVELPNFMKPVTETEITIRGKRI